MYIGDHRHVGMRWGDAAKKRELFTQGVTLCQRFLELNGDIPLSFILRSRKLTRLHPIVNGRIVRHATMHYRSSRASVYIDPWTCRLRQIPNAKNNQRWSWPGYKDDWTPYGWLALGTARHVIYTRELATFIPDLSMEPPVCADEPTDQEAVAQAIRLFITNPDLLRAGRPMRYWYLREQLKLEPVETRRWERVLTGCDKMMLAQAYRWIEHGNRVVQFFYETLARWEEQTYVS